MKPSKLKQSQPMQSCDYVHVNCVHILHCNSLYLCRMFLEFDKAFLSLKIFIGNSNWESISQSSVRNESLGTEVLVNGALLLVVNSFLT